MRPFARIQTFRDRYPLVGPTFWLLSLQYYLTQLFVAAAWPVAYSWAHNAISDLGNTASLFAHAERLGVHYVLDVDMQETQLPQRLNELQKLLDAADDVYLTIDLDVLPAATAPGVSAPAALGVPLSVVEAMVLRVRASGKLRASDIAEYNPTLDQDRRTARAAARLAYRLL